MKLYEIFEGRGGSYMSDQEMERANRKRFGKTDAQSHDMRPGRGSDVMNALTPRKPRSKSNLRRGRTGVSAKDRMKKIKYATADY